MERGERGRDKEAESDRETVQRGRRERKREEEEEGSREKRGEKGE